MRATMKSQTQPISLDGLMNDDDDGTKELYFMKDGLTSSRQSLSKA